MAALDARLAEVAARQHALIRTRDIVAAGGNSGDARRRVDAGRWDRVCPGVFRIAGVAWTYEARVLAAVFQAGDGAVASHLCAARLWGLGFPSAAPEVSIPRGRFCRPKTHRVHQSTDLERSDVRLINGIPVTDPARTLLDLGRYLKEPALGRAVEAARRRELVDWATLVRCLARHARQGRHGITRMRAVIAAGMPVSEVTDTDSELMALSILREHGLPEPVLHHRIYADDGERLAELDLAWPDRMAAIEIDGTVHLDPAVKQKDDERDHFLRGRGWTVRRVWYEIPVREAAAFVRIATRLMADCPTDTSS